MVGLTIVLRNLKFFPHAIQLLIKLSTYTLLLSKLVAETPIAFGAKKLD